MATLRTRDAERLLHFIAEADDLGGDEPFTPAHLVGLSQLVPADSVAYCELDRVRRRCRLEVAWPDGAGAGPAELTDESWNVMLNEHPVCRQHQQGVFGALKLSDFLTQAELHRSHLYSYWFRPNGIEHELNVAIPSPLWHTKTFLFDRGRRDFSERDRLVLDFLQPHLARLWRAARTRRRLAVARAALTRASELDACGVVFLGRESRIELASPSARRLLREFFLDVDERALPEPLADWLETGTSTLTWRDGTRVLTVDRSGDALLLEEAPAGARLTRRERQILGWVSRGKTNAEIAEILWVAPSTVRKHLENTYAKLGVHTRTAAVTRFLGLLEERDRYESTVT